VPSARSFFTKVISGPLDPLRFLRACFGMPKLVGWLIRYEAKSFKCREQVSDLEERASTTTANAVRRST
jgi:hypothetical protein